MSLGTATLALSTTGLCAESPWKQIASLPHKTGFSGHFGATLAEQLVIGGGSYFDKPLWLEGEKRYSDHIYSLDSLEGSWKTFDLRLPYPIGHCAFASDYNALYLAGGINHEGLQSRVFKIKIKANEPIIEELSPMPVANGYGAGAVANGYLYVMGGVQTKALDTPTNQCWRLSLDDGAWERLPDLPGLPPMVPAASAANGRVYLFGGISYPENDRGENPPTSLVQAYCYDPEKSAWNKLSELPAPRVAACASPALFSGEGFILAGGFSVVHPGSPESHPGFDEETLLYHIATDSWTQGPPLEKVELEKRNVAIVPKPMIPLAAPLLLMDEHLVLISGEVLPSVRSDCVLALPTDKLSGYFRSQ